MRESVVVGVSVSSERGKEKLPKFLLCIAVALINLIGTKCFLKENASKLRVYIHSGIHSFNLIKSRRVCLHFSHHVIIISFYFFI